MPLHDLSPLSSAGLPKCLSVHQASERVASSVGAVWIHLTAIVTGLYVDLGLINEADNLDIGGSFDELDASESTSGDQACALDRREDMYVSIRYA